MKKALSIILAAAIMLGGVSASAVSRDYDDGSIGAAAESLRAQGVLLGDENGNLNLDSAVTRAEFCKLVLEAIKAERTDDAEFVPEFGDVSDKHWAYDYIHTAAERKIVNGFEDGNFRPEDSVTYEQAIKIALVTAQILSDGCVYPTDYISAAIDKCLSDGMKADIGEPITREDAVNLIYNVQQYAEENTADDMGNMSFKYSGGGSGAVMSNGAISAPGISGSVETQETDMDAAMPAVGESAALYSTSLNMQPYFNTEEYTREEENIFKNTAMSPLSTFSIDTDTASYSNMRRFIIDGRVPAIGSVRSEELINYFDYDLPSPADGEPFSVTTEVADCPWNTENKLAMIAVKGEEMTERAPQNLTLLIDTSGSMYSQNKLPLVKKSMKLLLQELDERDTVSIVTYANGVNLALDTTNASEKEKIISALSELYAEGGTNGSGGLELAYEQAEKNRIDGNNRIILCTDGDFNIGPSSDAELEKLITGKREKGVFISVLGFGMGNYKDSRMEIIADKGNGCYYYIDNLREAKKVFVDEMTSTLYTIAKDVKIQVEFNPLKVSKYRLVGYENRKLNNEDFADDTKDAGELGAGTTVVALYELVMTDGENGIEENSGLRYQSAQYKESDELLCVNLRYKEPSGTESRLMTKPVDKIENETSDNFRFAASAAELGMILNDSEYIGSSTYQSVAELAKSARGEDKFGIRTEFIQLVDLLRYIDR